MLLTANNLNIIKHNYLIKLPNYVFALSMNIKLNVRSYFFTLKVPTHYIKTTRKRLKTAAFIFK